MQVRIRRFRNLRSHGRQARDSEGLEVRAWQRDVYVFTRGSFLMPDHGSVPPTLLLTEPQRRHFEVVLAKLEDALDEVDRLARPIAQTSQRPTFALLADDLPPDFASRIARAAHTARGRIADLAAWLGLAPQHASRRRTVRALLIAEMVRLEDSLSPALKGYGTLDPNAPDVIDPALRELLALLATMLRALDAQPHTGLGGEHTP